MSVSESLDDLIGRLEKAVSDSGMTANLGDAEAKVLMTDVGTVCPKCGKKLATGITDCPNCGTPIPPVDAKAPIAKGDDCGCGDTKRKRLVKGKVQDQAYCKKCRGELGKCECMRKSGLDSMIAVLEKAQK